MSDYTPSLEEIRRAWGLRVDIHRRDELLDGFDRAIATAKAQALNDVADQMHDRFTASWIRGKAREYTHGPHKPVGAFAIPETEADCGDQGL